MANVDNQPYIFPADQPTVIAAAAIAARTFVKIAAGGVGNRPKVTTCVALTDIPFGVSATDANIGDELMVYRTGVVAVLAGAALTAGASVWPSAAGAAVGGGVAPAYGIVVADAASGASAPVALMIS